MPLNPNHPSIHTVAQFGPGHP